MEDSPPHITLTIVNCRGLHARAAAQLTTLASKFKAKITVHKDGLEANARSIMALMMLAAAKESTIDVIAQGKDANQALDAIETLVNNRFGEKD